MKDMNEKNIKLEEEFKKLKMVFHHHYLFKQKIYGADSYC